ncbi:hypothetical protein [Streptomyces sp. NPDC051183]|uniref:hypothetical protein n=1 Tax=Streptomyces sp. NPDC051183 TaxID=3155165 RepID=UPI00342B509F
MHACRAFGVRMRHRAGEDVADALADPDRGVAHLAHTLLTDPERLRDCVAEAPPAFDHAEQLLRAVAALTAAGLAPKAPVSCGEADRQGDGTYDVIGYGESESESESEGEGEVWISTLGRFAADHDENPAVRRALESAGFRWIDAELGAVHVTGLGVYCFGRRDPLDVHSLLFYWQDQ